MIKMVDILETKILKQIIFVLIILNLIVVCAIFVLSAIKDITVTENQMAYLEHQYFSQLNESMSPDQRYFLAIKICDDDLHNNKYDLQIAKRGDKLACVNFLVGR